MSSSPIQQILFPTDFSACAEGAFRHAAYLADRFGADLHVLHVVEHETDPERDWPDDPGSGHLQITLADVYADLGLPPPPDEDPDAFALIQITEEEVVGRRASDAILDYVHDEDIDLVVMGTHGRRGWRRGVLGSVAEAVTRRAPCPVLTVRPLGITREMETWPPHRVLAAVDGEAFDGPTVTPAILWAARLAVAYRAPLDLLHVTPPARLAIGGPSEAAHARTLARQELVGLSYAVREAVEGPLRVHVAVRTGEPAEAIATVAAETGAHLVAVGTRGRTGAGRFVLGSVAEAVTRTAPCPVLVVRDTVPVEADRADGAARDRVPS